MTPGRPVLPCNNWLAWKLRDGKRPTGKRRKAILAEYLERYRRQTGYLPADPKASYCYAVRRALRLAEERQ